jgi:hypothetical protein
MKWKRRINFTAIGYGTCQPSTPDIEPLPIIFAMYVTRHIESRTLSKFLVRFCAFTLRRNKNSMPHGAAIVGFDPTVAFGAASNMSEASNTAASSDSRADFSAQTTNW